MSNWKKLLRIVTSWSPVGPVPGSGLDALSGINAICREYYGNDHSQKPNDHCCWEGSELRLSGWHETDGHLRTRISESLDGGADADEAEEEAYMRGERSALSGVISHCCRHLGYQDTEAQKVAWIAEREAVIAALRNICADHGDNDWDEKLHLADVIEKHLHRHLPEK